MEEKISRREILRSASGTAVVSAVGIGGLLSMLANRQAVAAGTTIAVVGVTDERGDRILNTPGAAHRHTFRAGFIVKSINPDTGVIIGDLVGQTDLTLETGPHDEPPHRHPIRIMNAQIGGTVDTGVASFHAHSLRVD